MAKFLASGQQYKIFKDLEGEQFTDYPIAFNLVKTQTKKLI